MGSEKRTKRQRMLSEHNAKQRVTLATMSPLDSALSVADQSLRTLFANPSGSRPTPQAGAPGSELSAEQRRLAGALMRVNHVGEVCAQALYQAQALGSGSPQLKAQMQAAAREEADHLAWTAQRLRQLGDRPSLLNPLWYAGAFAIGLAASRLGDARSLGFVVETERQVEAHLAGHLERLPSEDSSSRAIVEAMRQDEVRHGEDAFAAGAELPPAPIRFAMRLAAKVMTRTAHYI
jgi:3-demethoxyubiquinol 3-hydroxylase